MAKSLPSSSDSSSPFHDFELHKINSDLLGLELKNIAMGGTIASGALFVLPKPTVLKRLRPLTALVFIGSLEAALQLRSGRGILYYGTAPARHFVNGELEKQKQAAEAEARRKSAEQEERAQKLRQRGWTIERAKKEEEESTGELRKWILQQRLENTKASKESIAAQVKNQTQNIPEEAVEGAESPQSIKSQAERNSSHVSSKWSFFWSPDGMSGNKISEVNVTREG